jgi:hypothetical protein
MYGFEKFADPVDVPDAQARIFPVIVYVPGVRTNARCTMSDAPDVTVGAPA